MRRTTLGIIALSLLVVGLIAVMNGPGGSSAWGFSGVCLKSGLVLGALWLALPQIQSIATRLPRSLLGWFIGKQKDQPGGRQASESSVRQRRPRRRSSS
jgi:hypothetical protein